MAKLDFSAVDHVKSDRLLVQSIVLLGQMGKLYFIIISIGKINDIDLTGIFNSTLVMAMRLR